MKYIKLFEEYEESERYVYRIDNSLIKDFSDSLRVYYHSSDWTQSGTFETEPDNLEKSVGLFAGRLKDIVPYSTPRSEGLSTQWIIYNKDFKKPTIAFNIDDKQSILDYHPILSKFDSSKFKKLPNGEYFSQDAGIPINQERISNSLDLISKYYNIEFVDDIKVLYNNLKNNSIDFDSEL